MWIYDWKSLTISHHFALFSGHWFSVSGDIKYLIYYVTSHNHVVEGSCNLTSGSSKLYVNTLSNLWTPGYSAGRDMFLVYNVTHHNKSLVLVSHMILQDHMIKQSSNFKSGSHSPCCPVWWPNDFNFWHHSRRPCYG